MLETIEISENCNLPLLINQINHASWNEDNDLSAYSVDSLLTFISNPNTFFIATFSIEQNVKALAGIASATKQLKPYENKCWLYVDEIDVCANFREQGVGKTLMQKLLYIAKEQGCNEVWLGTEVDNTAANALYQSLVPHEKEIFVGYSFPLTKN